jgi:hypothetical protein
VVDTGASSMWHWAKILTGEGVEHSSACVGQEGPVMSASAACVELCSAVAGGGVGGRAAVAARGLGHRGKLVPACAIIFLGNLAGGLGGLCQYLQLRWRVLAQPPTLNPRGAS